MDRFSCLFLPKLTHTITYKTHTLREEIVKQGNRVIELLQERLTERAADSGDPLAFLSLPGSREAVRKAVKHLEESHDDELGGWPGMRGMKFPQVQAAK